MFWDLGRNLKKEFFDFSSVRDKCASLKHLISLPRELLSEGFTAGNVFRITVNSVLLPGLTVFTVAGTEAAMVQDKDGQIRWDFTENITAGDIADLFAKGGRLRAEIKKIFSFAEGQKEALWTSQIMY